MSKVPSILKWTNQDPRESILFNDQTGLFYRFQTNVSTFGQSVTTLTKCLRPGKEDKVAKLEWAPNGGLGRVIIGKNGCPMSDLVRQDARTYDSRLFSGPDGFQYRWRPSNNASGDILLQDVAGKLVAFYRPTRPMRYTFDDGTVADVFGELHFSTDGNTTVTHPPMMDTITVTALLYRFCKMWGL